MKLKYLITILTLVLPLSLYAYASYKGTELLDYVTSEVITYLLIWGIAIFFMNLIALTLNKDKYVKWLLVSAPIILISIGIAYSNMRGSSTIVSFDGELISWLLASLYSLVSIGYFIIQFVGNRKINRGF